MKILLALSGGVDSTVAGHILKQRGHDVVAAFLTHDALDPTPAEAAARELGIPLIVEDIQSALEAEVFPAFERAYAEGRTPNPCVLCNPTVKFSTLIDVADREGCERVATGHYARTDGSALMKSLAANDQSYMLCRLTPDQLVRCCFPLGEFRSKEDVRAYAAEHGISAADRPDSMEICFIPDGDYAAWLRARGVVDRPGDFVDADGRVLGRHGGILGYTVGMRRGLGISDAERLYVKRIDPTTDRIILAHESDMYTKTVRLGELCAVSMPFDRLPREVTVRLRHSRSEERATLSFDDDFSPASTFSLPPRALPFAAGHATLTLSRPVRIPAPGQFAAIYVGEVLAASGVIEAV